MNKKILIINDYGILGGGTENRVRLFIKELLKINYFEEIHLLEHENSNSLIIKKIKIHKCSTKNSSKITERIIKENNINIIQVHNLAVISVRPIVTAKKLKKPVIFSAHDYWPFCARRDLLFKNKKICSGPNIIKCSLCVGLMPYLNTLKNKYWINKCDVGIAPSNFLINLYKQNNILKNKWIKILPWIDLTKFYPTNILRDKTILFVGSLNYYKGADLLASAFKYIKKEIFDVKLKFVGVSGLKNEVDKLRIKNILKNSGHLDCVNFLGYMNQDELRYEFNQARVFVCCPVWPEVFGQTWAQAAACRCPLVVTDVGSIPELSNGLTSNSSTNHKILAQKIIQVFNKKKDQNLIRLENYVRQKFNVNNSVKQILNIYKALIKVK